MSFALQLAGSLAAILLLAAFARWLGLGRPAPLTEEQAIAEAGAVLPALRPHRAEIAPDGRSALVEGVGGRARVEAHGVRWVVRPLP